MSTTAHNVTEFEFRPARRKVASYTDCSNYARACGITTSRGWFAYHNVKKGGNPRPPGIPGDPSKQYVDEWQGWAAFLGTNNRTTKEMHELYTTLEETKKFFQDNQIDTVRKFRQLCKAGNRPENIPACPDRFYNVLFSDLLASRPKKYLDFNEARDIVRELGLMDYREFRAYRKANLSKYETIPGSPDRVYGRPVVIGKDAEGNDILGPGPWTSWPDFLGYKRGSQKSS